MLLPALVIEKEFARDTLRQILLSHIDFSIALIRIQNEHLKRGECAARIAVCKGSDCHQSVFGKMDALTAKPPLGGDGVLKQTLDVLRIESLEYKDAAA